MNGTWILLLALQGGFNLLLVVALGRLARRVAPPADTAARTASGSARAHRQQETPPARAARERHKLEPHLRDLLEATRDPAPLTRVGSTRRTPQRPAPKPELPARSGPFDDTSPAAELSWGPLPSGEDVLSRALGALRRRTEAVGARS